MYCFLDEWEQFKMIGEVLVVGYGLHYIPYFFIDRTLFLHHYMPALVFKILLCAAFMQHLANIAKYVIKIIFTNINFYPI